MLETISLYADKTIGVNNTWSHLNLSMCKRMINTK